MAHHVYDYYKKYSDLPSAGVSARNRAYRQKVRRARKARDRQIGTLGWIRSSL